MFSGIVEAVGELRAAEESAEGRRLTIAAPFKDLALGESVCVNGVCLTVVDASSGAFAADVSAETLRRTTLGKLVRGSVSNLERSLRLGDRLSGHLVFGHVDGVGHLISKTPEGDSTLYEFAAPREVARYLVEKGSVAVDGVSLTVFGCIGERFSAAVIPHTAQVTTLGRLTPGDEVNFESDMLAKYVENAIRTHRPA